MDVAVVSPSGSMWVRMVVIGKGWRVKMRVRMRRRYVGGEGEGG